MSVQPVARLSGEEIVALKFAAHRQLSRWASKPSLTANQRSQRATLKRAVQAFQHKALAHGCELRATRTEGDG